MKDWLKAGISIIGGYISNKYSNSSGSSSKNKISVFDFERIYKDVDKKNYWQLAADVAKLAEKAGIGEKHYKKTNYAEILRNTEKSGSHSKTTEERINELNEQIAQTQEKINILKENKPYRFDFTNRNGKVDKDAYNEQKKEWDEYYKDLKSDLNELKKELKELKNEQKEDAKLEESKDEKKNEIKEEKGKKGELAIKKLGEYSSNGTQNPQASISEDILSKDAKTLTKEQQLAVLKRSGINIKKLKAEESSDGSVSLKMDNKYFRVVIDNNEIKIIQTVLDNDKAQTQVFKLSKV